MAEIEYPQGETVEAAIAWFASWSRVRDEPELSVRGHAQPGRSSPVVLLAAACGSRRERGLPTKVEINGHPWTFESLAAVDSPRVSRSEAGKNRRTYSLRTNSLAAARLAAEQIAAALEARTPEISPSLVRMVRFVIEELGVNVVQHSGAPQTGAGWADVDDTNQRFELAFADCGIGIQASLQKNPELAGRVADDAEALQLALTPRVSGTGPSRKNMGWGLKSLVDLSDLLNGDLHLASGSAMLSRRTRAGQRTNAIRAIPPWQGTWICLEARLN